MLAQFRLVDPHLGLPLLSVYLGSGRLQNLLPASVAFVVLASGLCDEVSSVCDTDCQVSAPRPVLAVPALERQIMAEADRRIPMKASIVTNIDKDAGLGLGG